eukprot:m.55177 g.55177  ORF g.55177 m.55177 type:complete len:692 (-) comp22030_c1_seq1:33-2108(-)
MLNIQMVGVDDLHRPPSPPPLLSAIGKFKEEIHAVQRIVESYGPGNRHDGGQRDATAEKPDVCAWAPWAHVCECLIDTLKVFPVGFTPTILISELQQKLKQKSKRKEGTIASVYDRGKIGIDSVLDVCVACTSKVDNGAGVLLGLFEQDRSFGNSQPVSKIDMYLHRKFEHLVGTPLIPDIQSVPSTTNLNSKVDLPRIRASGFVAVPQPSGGFRLLPTEYIMPVVVCEDSNSSNITYIMRQFGTDSLSNVQPNADINVLAQVLEIADEERVRVGDRTERVVVTISDLNNTAGSTRELVLWDNQKLLAGLLARGQVIALARPFIPCDTDENGRHHLEYGSATVIVLVDMKHNDNFEMSQMVLSQALNQVLSQQQQSQHQLSPVVTISKDCERLHDCVQVTDLQSNMRHITITLCLHAISGNQPRTVQSNFVEDSFAFKAFDDTGVVDVIVTGLPRALSSRQLGGALVQQCSRLRTGQIVIFSGVSTEKHKTRSNTISIKCQAEHGGVIRCASTAACSLLLGQLDVQTLHAGVCVSVPRFITKAAIVEVLAVDSAHRNTNAMLKMVHTECRFPAQQNQATWDCPFCQLHNVTTERAYWLEVVIDDGTLAIRASLTQDVIDMLFSTSPASFLAASETERSSLFSQMLCVEMLMDICCVEVEGNSERSFRVDAILSINPQMVCVNESNRNSTAR